MKRQEEPKTNEKQALINRAYLVAGSLVVLALFVVIKLVRVQYYEVYKEKTWAQHAEQQDQKLDTVEAMRGNIYASDGSLLATSLPFYKVGIDPSVADSAYFADHLDQVAGYFATQFGEYSKGYYLERIRNARAAKKRYVPLLSRAVNYLEREKIETWPFFQKKKSKGGKFDPEYRRYRPFSPMADRTIGALDPGTGHGRVGLEASFDKQLAGTDGISWVEVLPGGVKIPVGDELNIRPEAGYDIHSTLDINFQDVAESALKKALENYKANFGCVVVMEVATGKIKAMSNLTRKGPNEFSDDKNYALTFGADPGSTFKLATMMAILEETGINPDEIWVDTKNGRMNYGKVSIEDSHTGGFGKITASQVLEKSSNIGTHLLMQKYFYKKPDKYLEYLDKFRLKDRTGLAMQGETAPLIRDRSSKLWSKSSLTYMSYGYEMRLAPIQILALYNAIANNGYWVRPMIVEQVRSSAEVIDQFEPYVDSSPLCSEKTLRKIRSMLEGVVQRGTAPLLKESPYLIAGKTGTAQKTVNGKYLKNRALRTSFVGYFPANRPKYSCFVLVDNSLGSGTELYASEVAAPVFKQVADRIYAYDLSLHEPAKIKTSETAATVQFAGKATDMQLLAETLHLSPITGTEDEWVHGSVGTKGKTRYKTQSIEKSDVPDLRGMPLRDALFIMENKGFRVTFKGKGKVVSQSLTPGSTVSGQKSIMLSLQ
ncbi:penicillin-binding protein [Arundinibacter roseus]|uniref:PASTA domain-containing protein n=1 Tax=Arundinibacter roseus TaxID=2070510 RepID=A0A4V2XAV6_9BACT|nr:penicillin-binding protein [Arundinibacter roseus]TDB68975.1 PASTA domain-containing protein [Arundinibacter roseus]